MFNTTKFGLAKKIKNFPFPCGQIGRIVHLLDRWGYVPLHLYLLTEIPKLIEQLSIKNIATSKRGPGQSPGKILKIYECSNFFDPPSLGFETFLTHPFWKLKTFLTPPFWSIKTFLIPPHQIFQPPHQGIYEHSLMCREMCRRCANVQRNVPKMC